MGYEARVDRSSGCSLGIDVNHADGETLLVTSIDAAGLLGAWNSAEPGASVEMGDRILEVNGRGRGSSAALLQECRSLGPLRFTLRPHELEGGPMALLEDH